MSALAVKAWEKIKQPNDPNWDDVETGFRESMQHACERVKETGVANTQYELKVLELLSNKSGRSVKADASAEEPAQEKADQDKTVSNKQEEAKKTESKKIK